MQQPLRGAQVADGGKGACAGHDRRRETAESQECHERRASRASPGGTKRATKAFDPRRGRRRPAAPRGGRPRRLPLGRFTGGRQAMTKTQLLLAEDDPAMIELLRWTFEREGFEVAQTPSGEEALLLAREAVPDIVILDWMLEDLTGIEVCRRLRRSPDTANVPILSLTARGEETD